MDTHTTKSLDELKRELEDLKAIHEQEKRNLAREEREFHEVQRRLAMRQDEKRRLDAQLTDLLTELMVHSDVSFAELVLKSIAEIEGGLQKSNPVVTGKDKEMAVLNKQFNETLGKLSGVELDQELKRARDEDKRLKQMVCDSGAELERLKDVKANNRKEISRRRKDNRQKINKLTTQYNELHGKLMMKKYGGGSSPESSQALDDANDE